MLIKLSLLNLKKKSKHHLVKDWYNDALNKVPA